MSLNFNCSFMAMSSLTYILGFSVRFFQPVYYGSKTKFGRHIVFAPFIIIIIIILSFFLSFFLSSVKSLSDTFLRDALIKLDETLYRVLKKKIHLVRHSD